MMGATSWLTSHLISACVLLTVTLLLVLCIGRARSSLKNSAARPAWLASFFALIGMLTLNIGVPLATVDGLLGGTNLWNLVEALAATCSFWFFRRAVGLLVNKTVRPRRLWLLALVLAAEAIPFFSIERIGPTAATFVDDHLGQLACYIYLMVYIVAIGTIAAHSLLLVANRAVSVLGWFLWGYRLIAIACASHLIYLTIGHFGLGSREAQQGLKAFFYVLFCFGVALLAVGWGSFFIRRQHKQLQPLWRIRALRISLLLDKITNSKPGVASVFIAITASEPRARAYADTTWVLDEINDNNAFLTSREAKLLKRVNEDLLAHLGHAGELAAISKVSNDKGISE
ncbi:hypothetical protein [Rathayibacter tritici]|uniref:hypothetical protein n=1 Tax=Rathayibacter tritici TaxID=33888 RepID=UPI0011B0EF4F|nr:hypothetical protein [Rathayibacter tritici]